MTKQTYIIAEAGVNHNGEKDKAFALVDVAVAAKANAVKFQTFSAEKLAAANLAKAQYQKNNTTDDDNQFEMLKKLELPLDWHEELRAYCGEKNIDFLSTAFDIDSLSFLNNMDLAFYKIPSGEITNAPLIWQYGQLNKPLILSTGMSTLAEVETALMVLAHSFLNEQPPESSAELKDAYLNFTARSLLEERVTLLHCTSQYPAPMSHVNLNAMHSMKAAFNLPVGYSDHTEGDEVAIAATALGATVIEKHFTLDRELPGPDHKASIEPDELIKFVQVIRNIDQAMGTGIKSPQPSEMDTLSVARQSLVAARNIKFGQALKLKDLDTQRVGSGISPNQIWDIVGETAYKDYKKGEKL